MVEAHTGQGPPFIPDATISHIAEYSITSLELNHLSLALLVTAKLEMFAALERGLFAVLAIDAFHTEHNFLGGLSLLSEDGLRLTTETFLFTIVTTTTLGCLSLLGLLVLRNLVHLVYLALLAVGTALLGHVHLRERDLENIANQ